MSDWTILASEWAFMAKFARMSLYGKIRQNEPLWQNLSEWAFMAKFARMSLYDKIGLTEIFCDILNNI